MPAPVAVVFTVAVAGVFPAAAVVAPAAGPPNNEGVAPSVVVAGVVPVVPLNEKRDGVDVVAPPVGKVFPDKNPPPNIDEVGALCSSFLVVAGVCAVDAAPIPALGVDEKEVSSGKSCLLGVVVLVVAAAEEVAVVGTWDQVFVTTAPGFGDIHVWHIVLAAGLTSSQAAHFQVSAPPAAAGFAVLAAGVEAVLNKPPDKPEAPPNNEDGVFPVKAPPNKEGAVLLAAGVAAAVDEAPPPNKEGACVEDAGVGTVEEAPNREVAGVEDAGVGAVEVAPNRDVAGVEVVDNEENKPPVAVVLVAGVVAADVAPVPNNERAGVEPAGVGAVEAPPNNELDGVAAGVFKVDVFPNNPPVVIVEGVAPFPNKEGACVEDAGVGAAEEAAEDAPFPNNVGVEFNELAPPPNNDPAAPPVDAGGLNKVPAEKFNPVPGVTD